MKLKVKDLSTAGLPAEGVYKMLVMSAKEVEGVSKTNNEPYAAVDVAFRLLEDTDGELRSTPHIYDRFFISSPTGLDRFMKLFEGIVGYLPTEGEIDSDGELVINTEDLLDEIRDREVWGVVVYGKPGEGGKVRANTGWSFADDAKKVSIPRALREATASA